MSSKTFTKWTEEERRAHRRTQNAAYQARKVEYLTPRQKQIKEEERKKRQETKQAMEQGEWVATMTGVKTSIKVEKKRKSLQRMGSQRWIRIRKRRLCRPKSRSGANRKSIGQRIRMTSRAEPTVPHLPHRGTQTHK